MPLTPQQLLHCSPSAGTSQLPLLPAMTTGAGGVALWLSVVTGVCYQLMLLAGFAASLPSVGQHSIWCVACKQFC